MSTHKPDGFSVGAKAHPKVPSFELRFRPSVDLITIVRRFVADFYLEVMEDHDVASRLALATHELLENAAKYSIDGAAALYVQVDLGKRTVDVKTTNRATPEQRALLRACFDEISAAPDAGALYAQMLKRTAALETGSGGLGLARVWAESEMSIRLEVDGDQVEIHAQGSIAAAS